MKTTSKGGSDSTDPMGRRAVAELSDLDGRAVGRLRRLASSLLAYARALARAKASFVAGIFSAERRRAGVPQEVSAGAGDSRAWESGPGAPAAAPEPRPEGFLVARVAGEQAARVAPHALIEEELAPPPAPSTPSTPPRGPGFDEHLGELPGAYEDDAFVALARDPSTLWVFWDFSRGTLEASLRGLEHPRARLRIFDTDGVRVRELDLALESRSFYVTDLPPGRGYRAELVFVGSNGERRIGAPSNAIGLPRRGPSPRIDDRFATIPWGLPLSTQLDLFARGMPAPAMSASERSALLGASRSTHLGASEQPVHPPGEEGAERPRPWSGSRYGGELR